ncbi:hypothetical protein GCM10022377_22250 [Zhihengliuella alba]|uniref:GmrSD restriction endonucleases C-terminal domain-containing protein n=1 Tax=Zhihengliuella alba TaxID=547018 RepID=A0ABP7DND4_9MICC
MLLAVLLTGCAPAVSAGEPLIVLSEAASPTPLVALREKPTPPAASRNDDDAAEGVDSSGQPAASGSSPGQSRILREEILGVLGRLEVKGRAPQTGYDRDLFGNGWKDPDRNGCDARNDTLKRDLTAIEVKPATGGCVVLSGLLEDPFTGNDVAFLRGQETSADVQIDHLVALSDAWQKGAQQLDPETRELFANDPLNLLAVDGAQNMSKGDGDAATWLPPNKAFRCDYVARQVQVKEKYRLWVTPAERDAITAVADAC